MAVGDSPHHVVDRLLNQELFRGALTRERKRADRSNQKLALLVIGLDRDESGQDVRAWRTVIAAVRNAKRECDVLGWLRRREALALLVTEVPPPCEVTARDIRERVEQELRHRLSPHDHDRLSFQVHVHPIPAGAEGECFPLASILKHDATRSRVHRAMKRGLDVLGSAALLTLLAPVFVVLAACVRLTSRGPVFFRQTRVGEGGVGFTMLKFRTMQPDASPALHKDYVSQFIKAAASDGKADSGVFKLTNDPRITPIGRFLRRTSMDELPQLWNVLRGDMSLVGPRPPLPYEVEQYKSWHCRRVYDAKPGVTGLWQVTGRSRTTFDEMVRLDLRYARAKSLWLDVKILLATPGAVIGGKGAC